jgi:serine/threonine-protein kinase
LHPHLARDTEFATMFLDEARIAARVQHPNVVQTLDVVSHESELLLVMEYVRGETLSRLLTAARKRKVAVPQRIISAILLGVLHGLDAAHEAKSENGQPLDIVHRDVSPQNVLVGADGVVRVVDFGVAKAASRAHSTRDGQIKGKLQYMAPEQIKRDAVDRRADVYAVGVMLWECLASKKLFVADDALAVMHAVLQEPVQPIGELAEVSVDLATVVHRALDRDPAVRFATAAAMAEALEAAVPPAPQRELAAWVREMAGEALDALEAKLADIESSQQSAQPIAQKAASASLVALTEQPTSMVSGISVVNDTPAKRRPRMVPLIAAISAVVVVGALIVWRVTSSSQGSVQAVPTHVAPPDTTTTAPAVTAAVETTTATPPPTVSVTSTATTTAKANPVPTHVRPPVPRSSAKPTANCTPPVYVDSAGIEHVKPECLK